ncbi:MAG: hypothetical protein WBK99_00175 [Solirubrobacterales bacterium]
MRCKIEKRKRVELGQTAWSIAKKYGWGRTPMTPSTSPSPGCSGGLW